MSEFESFVSLLREAHRISKTRQPLLVNVVDPGVELGSADDDLRQKLLPTEPGEVLFAAVELGHCPSVESLTADVVAQLLAAFQHEAPERDKWIYGRLRRDVYPWSPRSLRELGGEVGRQVREAKHDKAVALFGLDELPPEWDVRVVAAVRALAGSFGIRITFLVSEQRHYSCDLRIRNALPIPSEFQEAIEEHLASIEIEDPSGDGKAIVQPYWRRLSRRLFPVKTREKSSPTTLLMQGSVAELVAAATYPSRRVAAQAMTALQAYAFSIGSRSTVTGAAAGDATGDDDVRDARAAADSAAMQTLFLILLDVAFPALMQRTQSEPNGYHHLYRLQLRLTADARKMNSLSSLSGPWVQFASDPRLRGFFSFAMGQHAADGTRRVMPFTSATAIKRHVHMILDPAKDQWSAFLDELRNDCERITREARSAEDERPGLQKACEESEGALRRAQEELVAAAESATPSAPAEREKRIREAASTVKRAKERAVGDKEQLDKRWPYKPSFRTLEEMRRDFERLETPANPMLTGEPGDRIEDAWRRLSLLEMVGRPRDDAFADWWSREVGRCIGDLRGAQEETYGALGLDAEVGRARAHALLGELALARDAIAAAAVLADGDPVAGTAIEIGKAFLIECEKNWGSAMTAYEDTLARAESLGAHEVSARAAYGILRCRIGGQDFEAWQPVLRAQAFLSIQAARSPFVVSTVQKSKCPRLFVSYRSKHQSFVDSLRKTLKDSFEVWVDFAEIDNSQREFQPAIQLGLDRSDGVVVVISPDYFESHWCTYELATMLARKRLNGQRVDWFCLDDTIADGKALQARDYVMRFLKPTDTKEGRSFQESQLDLIRASDPLVPFVVGSNQGAVVEDIARRLRDRYHEGRALAVKAVG